MLWKPQKPVIQHLRTNISNPKKFTLIHATYNSNNIAITRRIHSVCTGFTDIHNGGWEINQILFSNTLCLFTYAVIIHILKVLLLDYKIILKQNNNEYTWITLSQVKRVSLMIASIDGHFYTLVSKDVLRLYRTKQQEWKCCYHSLKHKYSNQQEKSNF